MSARGKLNRAFFNGSLLFACIIGAATGSWLLFGLSLATLLAVNVATGEIRFRSRQR